MRSASGAQTRPGAASVSLPLALVASVRSPHGRAAPGHPDVPALDRRERSRTGGPAAPHPPREGLPILRMEHQRVAVLEAELRQIAVCAEGAGLSVRAQRLPLLGIIQARRGQRLKQPMREVGERGRA
jgi:hypothetical protein